MSILPCPSCSNQVLICLISSRLTIHIMISRRHLVVNATCTHHVIAVAMVGNASAFIIPLIQTILLRAITTRSVLSIVKMLLILRPRSPPPTCLLPLSHPTTPSTPSFIVFSLPLLRCDYLLVLLLFLLAPFPRYLPQSLTLSFPRHLHPWPPPHPPLLPPLSLSFPLPLPQWLSHYLSLRFLLSNLISLPCIVKRSQHLLQLSRSSQSMSWCGARVTSATRL